MSHELSCCGFDLSSVRISLLRLNSGKESKIEIRRVIPKSQGEWLQKPDVPTYNYYLPVAQL